MVERGMGEYQIHKSKKATDNILKVLLDGKPHRYNEIVDKTKLSTATVSKHLKRLAKEGSVTKEVVIQTGVYPYPALYKISIRKMNFQLDKRDLKKLIDLIEDPFLMKTLYSLSRFYILEAMQAQRTSGSVDLYKILEIAVKKLMKLRRAQKTIEDTHQKIMLNKKKLSSSSSDKKQS